MDKQTPKIFFKLDNIDCSCACCGRFGEQKKARKDTTDGKKRLSSYCDFLCCLKKHEDPICRRFGGSRKNDHSSET